MTNFELTNEQRKYFGLEPIEDKWDKVILKGDFYRPESILYFEKDIIKRNIVSTEIMYSENQYNEQTLNRKILLPKTNKGKEKKLTASTLEQRQPNGVYLHLHSSNLLIGNYNTQTTFYSSRWDNEQQTKKSIEEIINDFIINSHENHINEINLFKEKKRQNIKYKTGDYFCFKIDRTNYGFGRIVLDLNKIRKNKIIDKYHGLNLIMGSPIYVELFVFKSVTKNIDINFLDNIPKLPTDLMMDNHLFYGEYEIIGNKTICDQEYDFPISYGKGIFNRNVVFLQWGLIYKELPIDKFSKYWFGKNELHENPYGFYGVGFNPHYDKINIIKTINNNGIFNFEIVNNPNWDLRNPKNKFIKDELFEVFGLDANKSYYENSVITNTILPSEILKHIK